MSSPPHPHPAKTGIGRHHSAAAASDGTSDAITPNGHHHGTSSATSDAVTPNGYHHGAASGVSVPNGYRHSTLSASSEDDLELTLGLPSFNNNVPPPPMQQPRHQNHNLVPPPPPPLKLQPFFFLSLPTNGPLPNPNTNASPFPPQVAVQPPAAVVREAPSSSTGNLPRRQQPRQKQSRSGASRGTTKEKSETIQPPYPWTTDKRCGIHPFKTLISHGHRLITGRVKCRKCERSYEMAFDLETKFVEVGSFLGSHKEQLKHRAPDIWMNPALPECAFCRQKNAVRPEIEGKKKNINWLFLFLGQMLGCCTGEQLKYFCKHNCHHRTAAKDRLLYLAYLCMCKQLDPTGPFDLKL